jgi:acetolactate synthase I/III small subunit
MEKAHMKNHDKHTISLYVSNKPGVLIRIALVFARRGYNVDSLVVSEGHDPAFSHMTISATGDRKTLDQILKQLNKLVDVVHAKDHTEDPVIEREMALMKVRCPADKRGEILQMAHVFDCETIDLTQDTITLEVTGETAKLDNVHTMFNPFGIIEMVRTGKVLIMPGPASSF